MSASEITSTSKIDLNKPFALRAKRVITPQGEQAAIVVVENERIQSILAYEADPGCPLLEIEGVLMPALVDSHVHVNEPGRTDWEGFDTATHAAAAGGIATLVDMPLNCVPVTISDAALAAKLEAVDSKIWVDCGYWGGATADNLADLPDLLKAGVLGVKSFTIHSGIDEFQAVDEQQLKDAMRHLANAELPHLVHAELDIHCQPEVEAIGRSYSRFLQSRPRQWENDAIAMVIRVMRALREEGLTPRAHIVHLSSSDAIPMITQARDEGLLLTVETCPHYLTLWSEDIPDGATLYKCCPPIRENQNRDCLWQGLKDGVIDFIVSDHSPCTPQLKAIDSGDIGDAWGGISALQFGLALIWTEGQKRGFDLTQITRLMAQRPAEIAGLGAFKGQIATGYDADFCVFDCTATQTVTAETIKHKHKISPYLGKTLQGKVLQTWLRGKPIYQHDEYTGEARGKSLLRGHTFTLPKGIQ
ncbi:allantoinase AllB [Ketobacter sp. MCCC 1A13808]|uniref:allantoinase AllB n=1 Tax=Ketobacter sp. MCCC 1A13808 TaxID=2602738 RepID=UPI000F241D49|nr:allantoinase AllB [Ketobacter sp. MCCC 1A13808]MVF12065.1 allantoinase AllB [Ketobacter sp. MCCC 1A13808]RLP52853.1 MAG: allantoinase AllB [Ketobacter sp.]